MAASPDDRFAGLINSSTERGGWVPGDVFAADSGGDEEIVEPRGIRLPVLVALAVVLLGVLVGAFFLFRPTPQHVPIRGEGPSAPSSPQPTTQPTAGGVIVHVTGAVHSPSVVTLEAGARVQDAVSAAGGLLSSADAEAVNLARVLQDGEQIHIPTEGEDPEGSGPEDSGAAGPGGSGADGPSAKVDLNSADAPTLETLPGIGPVTAEAIIAHRQTQPFTAVEDLLLVKGIGPKTFESLRDHVTVG